MDRRVAPAFPDEVAAVGSSTGGGPVAETRVAAPPRLDHVPTPRASSPVEGPEAPASGGRGRGRRVTLAVALGTSVALLVTTGVVQHQREVRHEERVAADGRVAGAVEALATDAGQVDAGQVAGEQAWSSALATARAGVGAVVASGVQDLAATPHAGDGPRAALQTAVDVAGAVAADPGASLVVLNAAAASVAAPAQVAKEAEAAWQAAETARIAAEAKAAADAAAKAAAARSTVKKSSGTRQSTASQSSGSSGSGAPSAIPSGGLVCKGAPVGAGGSESSIGAIGDAINAFRASQGLPSLAVVRSGTLVGHAVDMANSGGIWHSGSDNIVGCTSSGSAQRLVNAWANSAGHRAQMVRTDVSTMNVGGASVSGWLYGAVKFSG